MKKFLAAFLFGLVGIACITSSASAILLTDSFNDIYYNNYENVFNLDGGVADLTGGGFTEGDHLVGIINVQNIDAGGSTIWFSSATDQITGIFVQQVISVYPLGSDALDPNQSDFDHVVLGAPDPTFLSNFDSVWGTSISSDLSGNEMFSLWRDPGTTVFNTFGTFLSSIDSATDGTLWMTLGYDDNGTNPAFNPAGSTAELADDDGYFYSHVDLANNLENLTGEAFGGLQIIFNGTGFDFIGDLNDINENEMDAIIANLLNDFITTSEFEVNPDNLTGNSPWAFWSNDPARIHPTVIPEPSTMLLLGAGLIGLMVCRRKKN